MHEWNCHLEIFYPSSSNRTLILGNICLSEQIFYRKQSLDAPEIRKQIFRILRFNTKRERCREHISLNIINGHLLFCFTGLWAFAINISQFGQQNKIASSSSITILRVDAKDCVEIIWKNMSYTLNLWSPLGASWRTRPQFRGTQRGYSLKPLNIALLNVF